MLRSLRSAQRTNRAQHGLSLIEVMVVISMLGIFLGAVYETVIAGLRTMSAVDDREEIRLRLTSALDRLTREASTASNLDVAQTAQVQFDTPSVNNVVYTYTSGTGILTRDDASSPLVTILRNLTAFNFEYLNCLGAVYGSGNIDTIRVVRASATVTQGSETVSVWSAAYLRNMPGFAGVPAQTCGTL